MATNLAKRLDNLEALIRRRVSAGPLYFALLPDEPEDAALVRLVAEGKINEASRNRAVLISRVLIEPADTDPAPELGDVAATPAIADAGEEAASRRFNRPLDYQPLGIL